MTYRGDELEGGDVLFLILFLSIGFAFAHIGKKFNSMAVAVLLSFIATFCFIDYFQPPYCKPFRDAVVQSVITLFAYLSITRKY